MSRTTTIAVYPGERTEEIEEYSNSWGSAPPVWEAMAREYLGVTKSYDIGKGWMELGDKLWDLWKDPRVKMEHRLVFMLTFDRAYIGKANYKRMADAIRVYLKDFPVPGTHSNHWPVFAELFDSNPEYPGVGLYCTSVSENPFHGEWNEDKEDYDPIDWEGPDSPYEICERIDEELAETVGGD